MKSNPDTLSVSQRIKAIHPGQRYSHIPISCLAALPTVLKLKYNSSVRNSVIIYFYVNCPRKPLNTNELQDFKTETLTLIYLIGHLMLVLPPQHATSCH